MRFCFGAIFHVRISIDSRVGNRFERWLSQLALRPCLLWLIACSFDRLFVWILELQRNVKVCPLISWCPMEFISPPPFIFFARLHSFGRFAALHLLCTAQIRRMHNGIANCTYSLAWHGQIWPTTICLEHCIAGLRRFAQRGQRRFTAQSTAKH